MNVAAIGSRGKTQRLIDILAQEPMTTGELAAAAKMSINLVSALMCSARASGRRVWRGADKKWNVTDEQARKVAPVPPARGRGRPVSIRSDTARPAARIEPQASISAGTREARQSPLTAPPYRPPQRLVRAGSDDFRRIRSRFSGD